MADSSRLARFFKDLALRPGRVPYKWDPVGKLFAVRLACQELEDRSTPAVVTWDGGAATFAWTDAANWDTNALPTAADDAVIPDLTGTPTIVIASGTQSVNSVTSAELVQVSGGTLTAAADSTLALGATVSSGTLSIAAGKTFTVAGGTVSGGTLGVASGGMVRNTGALALSGNLSVAAPFANAGTVTHSGTGTVTVNTTTMTNEAGATYTITGNVRINTLSTGAAFVNQGTLRRLGGAGNADLSGTVTGAGLVNQGAVEVQTGTLVIGGGTATQTGTFDLSSGTTLQFSSGTTTFNAGAAFSGAGMLAVGNGAININTPLTVSALSSSTGGQTTTVGAAGSLTTTGTVSLAGSTFAGTGPIIFGGLVTHTVSTTISNTATSITGTFNITGGQLLVTGGAVTVGSGGVLRVMSPANPGITGSGSLTAGAGGIIMTSGTQGISTTNVNTAAGGEIQASSGSLALPANGTHAGLVSAAGGGAVTIQNGTLTIQAGASYNGTGGSLTFVAATYNVTGDATMTGVTTASGSAAFNVSTGKTLTFDGSTLNQAAFNGPGTVRATGATTVANPFAVGTTGIFRNAGAMIFTSTSNVGIGSSGTFTNEVGATIDLRNTGGIGTAGSGNFVNDGVLNRSTHSGTATVNVPYSGTGLIRTLTGTLEFQRASTYTTAVTTSPGATTRFMNGVTHTFGTGAAFADTGTVDFANGTFSFTDDVTAASNVTLSSAFGTLTVATGKTFTMAGTANSISTNATIAGVGTVRNTGNLSVSGSAGLAINGTLANAVGAVVSFSTTGTVGGSGLLSNSGTLNSSSTAAAVSAAFSNSGTVNVTGGNFTASGGGTHSGTVNVDTGKLFRFTGGTPSLADGAAFTGAGSVVLAGATLSVAASANVSATNVTISSGTLSTGASSVFSWSGASGISGGSVTGTGTIGNGGTLTTSATLSFAPTLNNTGTLTVTSGTFTLSSFPTQLSGSTLTGGTWNVNGGTLAVTAATVAAIAAGAVVQVSGTGAFPAVAPLTMLDGSFTVTGGKSFAAAAGTLTVAGTGTLTVGASSAYNGLTAISNAGTIAVGGTLAGMLTQTAGTTTLTAGTLSGRTAIQGGTLQGTGTVGGGFGLQVTTGAVSPGASPGILNVSGPFSMTAASILNIEIQGTNAATPDFDQILITGAATLNGTLNVTYPTGILPDKSESFRFMTYASRSGNFATRNYPEYAGYITLDGNPAATYYDLSGRNIVVRNANDTGSFSLRDGIARANSYFGQDTIVFDVGTGVRTITPATPLPEITGELRIRGTTQPGYSGTPLIELDGSSAGAGASGLRIGSGGIASIVEGLCLVGWQGDGITLDGVENAYIVMNYFGVRADGTTVAGNRYGVQVTGGATYCYIGDLFATPRSVFAGNTEAAVRVDGTGGTSRTYVLNNNIGVLADGTTAAPNKYGVVIDGGATDNAVENNYISGNTHTGLWITGTGTVRNYADGNTIGLAADGTAAGNGGDGVRIDGGATLNDIGYPNTSYTNIISGNAGAGVRITGAGTDSNSVYNCWIGLDPAGNAPRPNAVGVVVENGAADTRIGTNGDGNQDAAERNVIAGNTNEGVLITGSDGSVVAGNYIGTNAAGTAAVPNAVGVSVSAATNTTVGGGTTAKGNVISGNTGSGVLISGTGTTDTGVFRNTIGLAVDGTTARPNGGDGVRIDGGASFNYIGFNTIAGNAGAGVRISGGGTAGNEISDSTIGLNAAQSAARPNAAGVVIEDGATGNFVMGSRIAGNTGAGVLFTGTATTQNELWFNSIGVKSNGVTAFPNGDGVVLADGAHGNTVGGQGLGNLISGNTGAGVRLTGGATGNTVADNILGLDFAKSAAVPNGVGVAVEDGAEGNTIGGSAAADRNYISGNTGAGVLITGGNTTSNTVVGNYIGTDGDGTGARPNLYGVYVLNAGSNRIGTDGDGVGDDGERNVISGNTAHGIYVTGTAATGNVVAGNYIGTNADGDTAVPNNRGITFSGGASANRVGATEGAANPVGMRNVISGNTDSGVFIDEHSDSTVLYGNHIGVDKDGSAAVGNGWAGVVVMAKYVVVGGPADFRNVIGGNGGDGILVEGDDADGTDNGVYGCTIANNFIGIGSDGLTPLGNNGSGVSLFDAPYATVSGNVISDNGDGIAIFAPFGRARYTTVVGNTIGLAADGETPVGNAGVGVYTEGPLTRIGDGTLSGKNVIAGNAIAEVYLDTPAAGSSVVGNFIGTDKHGLNSLGQAATTGVYVDTSNAVVGGDYGWFGGNLIGAGSVSAGLWLGQNAINVSVRNNRIGLSLDGVTPFALDTGVSVDYGNSITIGGHGGTAPTTVLPDVRADLATVDGGGVLHVLDAAGTLSSIDPFTGEATVQAATGLTGVVDFVTPSGGVYYFLLNDGAIYEVISGGAVTLFLPAGSFPGAKDIEYDATANRYLVLDWIGGSRRKLFGVDATSAAVTLLADSNTGAFPNSAWAIAASAAGPDVIVTADSTLYSYNIASGALSPLGGLGGSRLIAATRLPTGEVLFAAQNTFDYTVAIYRLTAPGVFFPVVDGLGFVNSIAVAADGTVYVSETPAGGDPQLVRVNSAYYGGNVIAGFTNSGVSVSSFASGVTVGSNFIGTDATGLIPVNGNTGMGIYLDGSGDVSVAHNVIGGASLGIRAEAGFGATISGNRVGIGSDGVTAIPNQDGVYIANWDTLEFSENVISGNAGYGFNIENSSNLSIRDNLFGLTADASADLGNGSTNYLTYVFDTTVVGNTFAASGGPAGVYAQYLFSVNFRLNRFGWNWDESVLAPNGGNIGLAVYGGGDVVIGESGQGNAFYDGLILSGLRNPDRALIPLIDVGVYGNRFGLNNAGTAGSGDSTLRIDDANNVGVGGGPGTGQENYFAGDSDAIIVAGAESRSISISSNVFGLTVDQNAAAGNLTSVLKVSQSAAGVRFNNNVVGNVAAGTVAVTADGSGPGANLVALARFEGNLQNSGLIGTGFTAVGPASFDTGVNGYGQAIRLARADDPYIVSEDAGYAASAYGVTVEGWVSADTLPAEGEEYTFAAGGQSGTQNYAFFLTRFAGTLRLAFRYKTTFGAATMTADVPGFTTSQYFHVAVAADGTKAALYLNGVLLSESDFVNPIGFDGTSARYVYVGGTDAPGTSFDGRLDEIGISTRGLRDYEVRNVYSAGGRDRGFVGGLVEVSDSTFGADVNGLPVAGLTAPETWVKYSGRMAYVTGNVFAAATLAGVSLNGRYSDNGYVFGNYFGTDRNSDFDYADYADAAVQISNDVNDVFVTYNKIVGETPVGIRVGGVGDGPPQNVHLSANSIYSPAGAAITPVAWVPGANAGAVAPELTAVLGGGATRVFGVFAGLPSTVYEFDFYAAPVGGQSRQYLGRASLQTNSAGALAFDRSFQVPLPFGWQVYATATDGDSLLNTFRTSQASNVLGAVGAVIGGVPAGAVEGTPITLTAFVAADPGTGNATSYNWTVRKGTAGPVFATSETAGLTFTPDDEATYRVTLEITTSTGAVDVVGPTDIVVTNAAPRPTVEVPDGELTAFAPIPLAAAANDPGPLDVPTYAWTVRAGSPIGPVVGTGSGANFNFTPLAGGPYYATAVVSDGDGGVGDVTRLLTVSGGPAQATVSLPATAEEGSAVRARAANADRLRGADPGVSFAWRVTDPAGVVIPHTVVDAGEIAFVPPDQGQYVVRLTVTSGGRDYTGSAGLGVTNVAPTPAITPPAGAVETGVPAAFTASAADPGTRDTQTFRWTVDGPAAVAPATGKVFPFAAPVPGVYVITLSAFDGTDSGNAVYVVTAHGTGVAAVITPPVGPLVEGETAVFTPVVSTPGAAFRYDWSVSKNNRVVYRSSSAAAANPAGFVATPYPLAFVPPDRGLYSVALTVTGTDGRSGTATADAAAQNAPPEVTLSVSPGPYHEGSAVTVTAAVEAFGVESKPGYAWTVNGVRVEQPAGWDTFHFVPPDDGPYSIGLSVTDDDGSTGEGAVAFTVENVAPTVKAILTDETLTDFSAGVVGLRASATDPGSADTPTYTWRLNGGPPVAGDTFTLDVSAGAGARVAVTATDAAGGTDTFETLLVLGNDGANRLRVAAGLVAGFTGDQILVAGFGGDDNITVDKAVTQSVVLDGGDGNDYVAAGSGPATLIAGRGTNVLAGGAGTNAFIGGGNDTMIGGPTVNVYSLHFSAVRLFSPAAAAVDVIDASRVPAGMTFDLSKSDGTPQTVFGTNTLSITGRFESFIGTRFADTLRTAEPNSTLAGGGGDDTLTASGVGVTLDGGAGNDSLSATGLVGGTLTGGTGGDTVTVNAATDVTVEDGDGGDVIAVTDALRVTAVARNGASTVSFTRVTGSSILGGFGDADLAAPAEERPVVTARVEASEDISVYGNGGGIDVDVTAGSRNVRVLGGFGDADLAAPAEDRPVITARVEASEDVSIYGGFGRLTVAVSDGSRAVRVVSGFGDADLAAPPEERPVVTARVEASEDVSIYGGTGTFTADVVAGSRNVRLIGGFGDADLAAPAEERPVVTARVEASEDISIFGGTGNLNVEYLKSSARVRVVGGFGDADLAAPPEERPVVTARVEASEDVSIFGGYGKLSVDVLQNSKRVTVIGGFGDADLAAPTEERPVVTARVEQSEDVSIFGGGGNVVADVIAGTRVRVLGGFGDADLAAPAEERPVVTARVEQSEDVSIFGGTASIDAVVLGTNVVRIVGGFGDADLAAPAEDRPVVTARVEQSEDVSVYVGLATGDVVVTESKRVSVLGGFGDADLAAPAEDRPVVTARVEQSEDVSIFGGVRPNVITLTAVARAAVAGGLGKNEPGDAADIITVTDSTDVTVVGDGGNDAVTVTGGARVLVSGDAGNDAITFGGSLANGQAFGAAGDDTFALEGGANPVALGGAGNDTFTVGGVINGLLRGQDGDDGATFFGGNQTVFLGDAGDDTATVLDGIRIGLAGGAGDDTLTVRKGAVLGSLFSTAEGNGGDDTIVLADGVSRVAAYGGAGNDAVTADVGTFAYVFGNGGDDTISVLGGSLSYFVGGAGDDAITSASGGDNNEFYGDGGDDAIGLLGGEQSRAYGGPGDDAVTVRGTDQLVQTESGNDAVTVDGEETAGVRVYLGTGDDAATVVGGAFVTVGGGAGNDTITAAGGSDVVGFGDDGFDDLYAAGGPRVILSGGRGDDLLVADGAPDPYLFGDDGNDFYALSDVPDPAGVRLKELLILPKENIEAPSQGADTLDLSGLPFGVTVDLSRPGSESDPSVGVQVIGPETTMTLFGTFENAIGTAYDDTITGTAGDNRIDGGGGNDALFGGAGNDTLGGGGGDDALVGGPGDDAYVFHGADAGAVQIQEDSETGRDALDFSGFGSAVVVDLSNTGPQPIGVGLTLTLPLDGVEDIVGSKYADVLTGNGRPNRLEGRAGDDTLAGGAGDDVYVFAGSALGSDRVEEDPGGAADLLDFSGFLAPIDLDLANTGPQSFGGALTLTLSDPEGVEDVVGTGFSDRILGNARPNRVRTAGGADYADGRGGADLLVAGLTQAVVVDFDTRTDPNPANGEHRYTAEEREQILDRVRGDYAGFDYVFTESRAEAEELTAGTGRQYITMFVNDGPGGGIGGESNEIDARDLNRGNVGTVDVNKLLGGPGQPAATSANFAALTGTILSHELGHMAGLRHFDAVGPIGSGLYYRQTGPADPVTGRAPFEGIDPSRFVPVFDVPVLPPDYPFPGPWHAAETRSHTMASPASLGTAVADSLADGFFGERELIKLAAGETGAARAEIRTAPGSHAAFATAEPLAGLAPLAVPNTLPEGAERFDQNFRVHALTATGDLALDGPTTERDVYSFTALAGEYANAELHVVGVIPARGPLFDGVLRLYDAAGNLLAESDDELETVDARLFDVPVPADGQYFVEVSAYKPTATGHYELFLSRFAAGTEVPASVNAGDTLVGGPGDDVLVGGAGDDLFRAAGGGAADADTFIGKAGYDTADLVGFPDLNPSIAEDVELVLDQNTEPTLDPILPQSVNEGGLLTFTAVGAPPATDGGDRVRYSLGAVAGSAFPDGAFIDPISGVFTWAAGQDGDYAVRVVVTDAGGLTASGDVAITVANVLPTLTVGGGETLAEGGTLIRTGRVADPGPDPRTVTADFGDGQFVPVGVGLDGSFTLTRPYPNSGPFTVLVKAADDRGVTLVGFEVTVGNLDPAAELTGPDEVPEGGTAAVGFVNATDPSPYDAARLKFAFDWDDDGTWDVGGAGYLSAVADPGTVVPAGVLADGPADVTVRGRVLDPDGGFADFTRVIRVTNVGPAVGPLEDQSVAFGVPVTFAAAVTDPGNDVAEQAWTVVGPAGTVTFSGPGVTFTPAASGVYSVRFTATDTSGATAAAAATLTVARPAPAGTLASNGPVAEGGTATVTLAVTNFTAAELPQLRYAFDLDGDGAFDVGDGTYAGGVVENAADLPAALTAAGAATRTVHARVIAPDGLATDYSAAIAVTNVAPVAPVLAGLTLTETSPSFTRGGSFADPGADTWTAKVNYGDGSGWQSLALSGREFALAHAYADSGVYTVTVVVNDEAAAGGSSFPVVVENSAPTAAPAAPAVDEGSTAAVTLSHPADPSAADAGALRFAFDFDGDGVFDLGDGTYAGGVASNAGTLPAALTADGEVERTVTARVIDRDGGFTDYAVVVAVANVAPTGTMAVPGTVAAGGSGDVGFGTLYDPSAADRDALRFAYDFDNDGAWDVGGATYDAATSASSAPIPAALLADGPSSFTVKGRVIDKDGGFTDYTGTVTVTAPTGVAGFDVQKGQSQRSFVRYIDLDVSSKALATALTDRGRVRLLNFGLDGGGSGAEVDLTGKLSADGGVLAFNFGPYGITGNPNALRNDGYYRLEIDLNGDGTVDATRSFYRLLGDTNGDRKVDATDSNNITAAIASKSYVANADVNGDGYVNGTDQLIALRHRGRFVAAWLTLDD